MADVKLYEMTQSDLDKILKACAPVPCIIVGGVAPRTPRGVQAVRGGPR